MKVKDLLVEDYYTDRWAKEQAAANRAGKKAWKDAERELKKKLNPPKERVKKEKPDLWEIWREVETAIGNSFPDGDPIDHLPRDLDMDLINKAVKLHAGPRTKGKAKYGLYDYLGDMWDDVQGDQMYDAKNMLANKDWHLFNNNVFYQVDNGPGWKDDHKTWDGWDKVKIVKMQNPWK